MIAVADSPATDDPAAAAVALIDDRLASMPSGRKLMDVSEHIDILLDLRLTFSTPTTKDTTP